MRFSSDDKAFWTFWTFSATDLSTHSECEHRTVLEMGVALRKWDRPGQSETGVPAICVAHPRSISTVTDPVRALHDFGQSTTFVGFAESS